MQRGSCGPTRANPEISREEDHPRPICIPCRRTRTNRRHVGSRTLVRSGLHHILNALHRTVHVTAMRPTPARRAFPSTRVASPLQRCTLVRDGARQDLLDEAVPPHLCRPSRPHYATRTAHSTEGVT